jgi:hypothetical protein
MHIILASPITKHQPSARAPLSISLKNTFPSTLPECINQPYLTPNALTRAHPASLTSVRACPNTDSFQSRNLKCNSLHTLYEELNPGKLWVFGLDYATFGFLRWTKGPRCGHRFGVLIGCCEAVDNYRAVVAWEFSRSFDLRSVVCSFTPSLSISLRRLLYLSVVLTSQDWPVPTNG